MIVPRVEDNITRFSVAVHVGGYPSDIFAGVNITNSLVPLIDPAYFVRHAKMCEPDVKRIEQSSFFTSWYVQVVVNERFFLLGMIPIQYLQGCRIDVHMKPIFGGRAKL